MKPVAGQNAVCKAVTCSMDEWKKHTVSVPLLNEKQLVARSMIRK